MRVLPLALILLLGACVASEPVSVAPPINAGKRVVPEAELADVAGIRFRHLDTVNALRLERGLQPVAYSQALNSAALTHARDMALQQRAWHFGSDRSNPQSRATRAGFGGRILGENIAETFEGEFDTMQGWLRNRETATLMLERDATAIGFAWYREPTGKIWWVQMFGAPGLPGT